MPLILEGWGRCLRRRIPSSSQAVIRTGPQAHSSEPAKRLTNRCDVHHRLSVDAQSVPEDVDAEDVYLPPWITEERAEPPRDERERPLARRAIRPPVVQRDDQE